MIKVLIVGKNSYIGDSFAKIFGEEFEIHIVDAKNENWKTCNFSDFDSVIHCAGIAHVSHKKVSKEKYFEINCDLAVAVAEQAKLHGTKQFIFLSSMAVYGKSFCEITKNTPPAPEDFYGTSKFEAEKKICALETENFKICIVRPPMVYGAGCKGNFPKLAKLAKFTPIFPDIKNKRSMIYIDNLCAFLAELVKKNCEGIFLPQNKNYVNTTELVKQIRRFYGKKTLTTKIFNPLINFFSKRVALINKIFGDLFYSHNEELLFEKKNFIESVDETLRQ
ncbi:MAG: NAD-dependent epimerase/dehydratase family protein [Defluviitaleaceae bacterium]|nr:NAD-dependent epimerase/dehydratase family protein [Defluviitaleaceae bacterium]